MRLLKDTGMLLPFHGKQLHRVLSGIFLPAEGVGVLVISRLGDGWVFDLESESYSQKITNDLLKYIVACNSFCEKLWGYYSDDGL
jgi:hypothetical protein